MKQKVKVGCKIHQMMTVHYSPNNARFIGEVLESGEYKFLLKKIHAEDLVIVDIGCNIGTFSLFVQDIAKAIYAIDPVKNCITDFNKTIADNVLTNIHTYQLAIGEKTCRGMLNIIGPDESGASFLDPAGKREVTVMNLNDFCEMKAIDEIDILKIDVEGNEIQILHNTNFKKLDVKLILGEFHIGSIKKDELFQIIGGKGYTPIEMPNNHFIAV